VLKVGVFTVRFLSKKVTKSNFFLKKNETGSNRPVSVRFGSVRFFREKSGSNRFGSVFSGLARFFRFGSVWLGFFRFFSGSVWFGFSGSRLKKPKPNRSVFLKF